MNIEEFRQYCLSKFKATESFPFDENTLVFKIEGKMFALSSLLKWEQANPSVNLKCDPEKSAFLREKHPSIKPGFHMNKKHWNTILINQPDVNQELLEELIDHSYGLVVRKLPKKIQDKLKITR